MDEEKGGIKGRVIMANWRVSKVRARLREREHVHKDITLFQKEHPFMGHPSLTNIIRFLAMG